MTTLTMLDDHSFDAAVKSAAVPMLLECGAAWCPPCRAIEPHLAAISMARKDVTVASVDCDNSPDIAARFGVRAMPTLLLLVRGRPVAQIVGMRTRAQLDAWLDAELRAHTIAA